MPEVENDGGLNRDCAGTLHLSWCLLRCPLGYGPSPRMLICGDGVWLEVARCEPLPCPEPEVPHAVVPKECNSLLHGGSCELTCDEGFLLFGGPLTCHLGQLNFPRCDRIGASAGGPVLCDAPPAVLYGDAVALSLCAGGSDGATCRLRCADGYEPSPAVPGYLECADGRWGLPWGATFGDYEASDPIAAGGFFGGRLLCAQRRATSTEP